MKWFLSHRADPRAVAIADQHYNRQKIGTPQFVPPGRCVVLLKNKSLWTTSWPFQEYVKHQWGGAWINSLFRNESDDLSSELIREAISATISIWPNIPSLGMVTFVDAAKIRHKRDPGRCYLKAGFKKIGMTKGGLVVLQMLPGQMPNAEPPHGYQLSLFP